MSSIYLALIIEHYIEIAPNTNVVLRSNLVINKAHMDTNTGAHKYN